MRRVVGGIATAALIVLGVMFSALLLAIIVTAGLVAFGYLWWKTRALRRQMREQFREQFREQATGGVMSEAEVFRGEVFKGEVIEGEVIRKVVSIDEIER